MIPDLKREIAERLKEVADLLHNQGSNPFRVQAYRHAAQTLEQMETPVDAILDVDREYREKANTDRLDKFAPRRFNPTGEAWLPVLHTQRGKFHYTALYSNTARAHKKGKTHDWVLLYNDDGQKNSQCTGITADWGILEGRRMVSGRESECLMH